MKKKVFWLKFVAPQICATSWSVKSLSYIDFCMDVSVKDNNFFLEGASKCYLARALIFARLG